MSRVTATPIGSQVHSFETYPSVEVSRSVFDRSHSNLLSMNADYLVPIWYDMGYPGDTLKLSISTLTRLMAQKVPFTTNCYMDIHVWSVPVRLVFPHWVNMNGENPASYDPSNPMAGTDYLVPQLTTASGSVSTPQSIYDYFDIPLNVEGLSFNTLNFRAYNYVFNEWYRDENLQDPVIVRTGDDGVDLFSDFTLLKRGKRKDYFTSALPFPQKGPTVDLPLGLTAPVVSDGTSPQFSKAGTAGTITGDFTNRGLQVVINDNANHLVLGGNVISSNGNLANVKFAGNTGLEVDLTSATASTINSLRQAFAVQRLYEKDARGGTRYTEMILSHFGVKSPDARLQRPEFLGGGTFNLKLNIVPQTSATTSGSPQANLASYGVFNDVTKKIVHSFTEHCIVFAVASIRADLSYQQGLPRDYSKRTRLDYYFPVLANLGEQAILNKEIYAQGTDADDEVFGYQERWAEMRYKSNRVCGMVRSTADLNLDFWHLAEDFSNLPTLSSEFIENDMPIDRVLAVESSSTVPQFISSFWFDEQWVRPMPVYSIPSMNDHF